MEYLLSSQFTWVGLLTIALELLALYFVLQFVLRILRNTTFLGRFQVRVHDGLHQLLLIFEPLAILLLSTVFILINPLTHGILFALFLAVGFTQVRDYLSGRLIQFNRGLAPGRTLRVQQWQGVINQLGRLGLFLQTSEGIHFLSYTRLLSEGYTLTSGEEIGGFYYLRIASADGGSKAPPTHQLMDLLAMAPYVDWHHKPQLAELDGARKEVEARVLVKEEVHLYELIALLRERGYTCEVHNP